jgi:hypothetical protein
MNRLMIVARLREGSHEEAERLLAPVRLSIRRTTAFAGTPHRSPPRRLAFCSRHRKSSGSSTIALTTR